MPWSQGYTYPGVAGSCASPLGLKVQEWHGALLPFNYSLSPMSRGADGARRQVAAPVASLLGLGAGAVMNKAFPSAPLSPMPKGGGGTVAASPSCKARLPYA
jgi:hypothetical protein